MRRVRRWQRGWVQPGHAAPSAQLRHTSSHPPLLNLVPTYRPAARGAAGRVVHVGQAERHPVQLRHRGHAGRLHPAGGRQEAVFPWDDSLHQEVVFPSGKLGEAATAQEACTPERCSGSCVWRLAASSTVGTGHVAGPRRARASSGQPPPPMQVALGHLALLPALEPASLVFTVHLPPPTSAGVHVGAAGAAA